MIPPSRRIPANRDRWMVSYLDVVTILLVFFVAAAAKTLAPAAPKVVQPVVQPPIEPALAEPFGAEILRRFASAGLEARSEPAGVIVSLPQAVLFAPGDDRIARQARPIVAQAAGILRTIPNRIVVTGHADSVPIHSPRFNNNWELSVARGMRMLELLTQEYGIDQARLSVSGDGSNRPAGANDTPEGRAANRRVELTILAGVASR